MATVTCVCPKCDQTFRAEFSADGPNVRCDHCSRQFGGSDVFDAAGHVSQCLICTSPELFVRKDFPQRLGVAIVCTGFLASCITWYYYSIIATFVILFCTAFIDLVLYLAMGNVLECYRCHSQFRDVPGLDEHAPFDLEVHERHRQLAARKQSRLAQPRPELDEVSHRESTAP